LDIVLEVVVALLPSSEIAERAAHPARETMAAAQEGGGKKKALMLTGRYDMKMLMKLSNVRTDRIHIAAKQTDLVQA
jgi:hypothetical protein